MSNNTDYFIWILFFFVLIIIFGLYYSEYTPLDLDEKKKIINMNDLVENFTQSISSASDQAEGASAIYNRGLPDDNNYISEPKQDCGMPKEEQCKIPIEKKCKTHYVPYPVPIEKKVVIEKQCDDKSDTDKKEPVHEMCKTCDITLNKDINKYVLKNSVPPCPDMSSFITKNMMDYTKPDMNKYILKSEIPACEKMDMTQYIKKNEVPVCDKMDMTQYIKKSDVPGCPTCPICPECPVCPPFPTCPPEKQCKEIYDYSITDHPDMSKYILKDDVNNGYISKDELNKNYISNDFVGRRYISKSDLNNNYISRADVANKYILKDDSKQNCDKQIAAIPPPPVCPPQTICPPQNVCPPTPSCPPQNVCPPAPSCPPQNVCPPTPSYSEEEESSRNKYIPSEESSNKFNKYSKNQYNDYNKKLADNIKKNEVMGFYAGDSLFAGV